MEITCFDGDFETAIKGLDDGQLLAQQLVQQGAIHAISYLIRYGCTETGAEHMLESLTSHSHLIRTEAVRRGIPAFTEDQIETGVTQ